MKIKSNKIMWNIYIILINFICIFNFNLNDFLFEKTRASEYDLLEFITKLIYNCLPIVGAILFCIFRKTIIEKFHLDSTKIYYNTSKVWSISTILWCLIIQMLKNVCLLFPYPYNCLFHQTQDYYLNGLEYILTPMYISLGPIIIIYLQKFFNYIFNFKSMKTANKDIYSNSKKTLQNCLKWCAHVIIINIICLIVCPIIKYFFKDTPFEFILDSIPIILLACYYIYDNLLCKKIHIKRAYLTTATLLSSLFIMGNLYILTIFSMIEDTINPPDWRNFPDFTSFAIYSSLRIIIYSIIFLTLRLIYKNFVQTYPQCKIQKHMWLIKSTIFLIIFIVDYVIVAL